MPSCVAAVCQEEMGIFDGRQRDGIMLGQRFISYFQIESSLLELAGVAESGVIASCQEGRPFLRVYLSLKETLTDPGEIEAYSEEVKEFLRQKFAFGFPITVHLREKLPMTRSGKILRSILRDWG